MNRIKRKFRRWVADLRIWLLLKLAGKSTVAINVDIVDGGLSLRGDRAFVYMFTCNLTTEQRELFHSGQMPVLRDA